MDVEFLLLKKGPIQRLKILNHIYYIWGVLMDLKAVINYLNIINDCLRKILPYRIWSWQAVIPYQFQNIKKFII